MGCGWGAARLLLGGSTSSSDSEGGGGISFTVFLRGFGTGSSFLFFDPFGLPLFLGLGAGSGVSGFVCVSSASISQIGISTISASAIYCGFCFIRPYP